MKLTKVNIRSVENHLTKTGGAHFHIFIRDMDGVRVVERTTAKIHALMKGKDGQIHNPQKTGHTWSHTIGRNEYDTPSGELEEGQYAENGEINECRFVGSPVLDVFQIPKTEMPLGEISKEEVEKINIEYKKEILWQ